MLASMDRIAHHQMDGKICLQTTHTYKGRIDDLDYPRQHHLLLHFATSSIRAVRLVIVTDQQLYEGGLWRQCPTYKKFVNAKIQDPPDIAITLLVSEKFHNKIIPISSLSKSLTSFQSLRILHDGTYVLDSETRRLEFFFECMDPAVADTPIDHESNFHDFATHVATIRAFPLHSILHERPMPSLPARCIMQIGKEIISSEDDIIPCARFLTTCALVCKDWYKSGVHDLLWQCFMERPGSEYMKDNRFRGLVNCVEQYPWIGERMLVLPCHNLDDLESGVEELRPLYGVLIKTAMNLKGLDLMTSQWDLVRDHLSLLRHVEWMSVVGDRGILDSGPVEIHDMLGVINEWKCLHDLRMDKWELDSNAQIPKAPASYKLHTLTMFGVYYKPGAVSVEIFKHLLSRPSSLRVLRLDYVTGLNQNDFKVILSLVKSTIVSLTIEYCSPYSDLTMSGSISYEEEPAFDAVVGDMPHLQSVKINQWEQRTISSRGILRKRPRNYSEGAVDTLEAWWHPAPDDQIQDLENALRYTGWGEVKIYVDWEHRISGLDFGGVEKIALERGIKFTASSE